MKFFASICALSAVAVAILEPNKVEERQIADLPVSVEAVLFTALPSSLLALAITNQAAASSEIASEFATGTPAWFASLPSNVQTYLVPSNAAAAVTTIAAVTVAPNGTAYPTNITTAAGALTTGNVTSNANGTLLIGPTITRNGTVYINGTVASTRASNGTTVAATGNATAAAGNGSTVVGGGGQISSTTGRASTTGASSSGASAAAATSTKASSSSGGASVPTGVISAGLAGIVAIAGVLAL